MLQVWIWCLLWLNCHTTTALPKVLKKTTTAAPSTTPATTTDPLTEEEVIACPRISYCIPPQYCNESDVSFKWRPKSSLAYVCGTLGSDGNICCATKEFLPSLFVPDINLWFYSESYSHVNEEAVVNVLPWEDFDISETNSTQELEQSAILDQTNISISVPGPNLNQYNQEINIHIDLNPTLLLSAFKDGGIGFDYNLAELEADTHLLDGEADIKLLDGNSSRKRRDVDNECPSEYPSECECPFVYKNVRYTECTTKDDPNGQPWCSTSTNKTNNLHLKGNWKHCNSISNVAVNGAPVLDEDTSGRSVGSDLAEDDGKLCGVSVNRLLAGRSRFDDFDIQEHKNLAKEGEYPWQVAILSRDVEYRCGGVVVGKRHVITVAHCVADVSATDILVRVGDFDLSSDEEQHPSYDIAVRWIKIHPSFLEAKLKDDLALLEVKFNLYRLVNVAPACLPTPGSYSDVSNCKVPGWGQLETSVKDMGSHKFTYTMMVAGFRTIPRGECQTNLRATRKVGAFFKLQKGNICAIGKAGGDACHGDGGSGLICHNDLQQYIVEGLVSWGIGCGLGHPGAYVDIRYYLDWIIEEMDSPGPLPVQSTSKSIISTQTVAQTYYQTAEPEPAPEPSPQNTVPFQPPVVQTYYQTPDPAPQNTVPFQPPVSQTYYNYQAPAPAPQNTVPFQPPVAQSYYQTPDPAPQNTVPFQPPVAQTTQISSAPSYFLPSQPNSKVLNFIPRPTLLKPQKKAQPTLLNYYTPSATRKSVVATFVGTPIPEKTVAAPPTIVATLEEFDEPLRPGRSFVTTVVTFGGEVPSRPDVVAPTPVATLVETKVPPSTIAPISTIVATLEVTDVPPIPSAPSPTTVHHLPATSETPPDPFQPDLPVGSLTPNFLPPSPGTGSLQLPPSPGTGSLQLPPSPPTGSLHLPPSPPTGSFHLPPSPPTGSLHLPPSPPTGSLHLPPSPPSGSFHLPPSPPTGSFHLPPSPPTGSFHLPPSPPTGSFHLPPSPPTGSFHLPPSPPTGSFHLPPSPPTGSFHLPPASGADYGPPVFPLPPGPGFDQPLHPGPGTGFDPFNPGTEYGPPPGPNTNYGPPPGPLPGPNTNFGVPPPGPNTDYGPPPGPLPGPNTNYGPPPGPNTNYGPPPGPNTNYGPPPGTGSLFFPPPSGSGSLPLPPTQGTGSLLFPPPSGSGSLPLPPTQGTRFGPLLTGFVQASGTEYGPPPGPNTNYGPPPGPNTDYGPPSGQLPGLNTNYGPPPGPNTDYGPPPGPLPGPNTDYGPPPGPLTGLNTNYSPPPGPNTNYGPPPGPNTDYGAPLPGLNTNFGPPPGPNTNYGPPSGQLPGLNTNFGPPPVPNSIYGAPPPGPLPGPNTDYGPPSGQLPSLNTNYGPPPGPNTNYGPPPGPLPGPNTNYGPPPGPNQDYGPPPGPNTNYGIPFQ